MTEIYAVKTASANDPLPSTAEKDVAKGNGVDIGPKHSSAVFPEPHRVPVVPKVERHISEKSSDGRDTTFSSPESLIRKRRRRQVFMLKSAEASFVRRHLDNCSDLDAVLKDETLAKNADAVVLQVIDELRRRKCSRDFDHVHRFLAKQIHSWPDKYSQRLLDECCKRGVITSFQSALSNFRVSYKKSRYSGNSDSDSENEGGGQQAGADSLDTSLEDDTVSSPTPRQSASNPSSTEPASKMAKLKATPTSKEGDKTSGVAITPGDHATTTGSSTTIDGDKTTLSPNPVALSDMLARAISDLDETGHGVPAERIRVWIHLHHPAIWFHPSVLSRCLMTDVQTGRLGFTSVSPPNEADSGQKIQLFRLLFATGTGSCNEGTDNGKDKPLTSNQAESNSATRQSGKQDNDFTISHHRIPYPGYKGKGFTTKTAKEKEKAPLVEDLPVNGDGEEAAAPSHPYSNLAGMTSKSTYANLLVAQANNTHHYSNAGKVCDICKNRQNVRDRILVCIDCSLKAHGQCLNYTRSLTRRAFNIGHWQCNECTTCSVCKRGGDESQLLLCDSCDLGYHMSCHRPPVLIPPTDTSWFCESCRIQKQFKQTMRKEQSRLLAEASRVADRQAMHYVNHKPQNEADAGDTYAPTAMNGALLMPLSTVSQLSDRNGVEMEVQTNGNADGKAISRTEATVSEWSVEQVQQFVTKVGFNEAVAQALAAQEIDGQALLLLGRDDCVTKLGLTLGPALKLEKAVNHLRRGGEDALAPLDSASAPRTECSSVLADLRLTATATNANVTPSGSSMSPASNQISNNETNNIPDVDGTEAMST